MKIKIIQDCKRNVKVKTKINFAKNETKKKQDQQNDNKKLKSGDKNIHHKHKTHKWSECPDNRNISNYTGNKGEKKKLEEKSRKNKNKTRERKLQISQSKTRPTAPNKKQIEPQVQKTKRCHF